MRFLIDGTKPARVLHVVGGMNRGGAETMIMNYYRNIDRGKLQFDFCACLTESITTMRK